MEADLFRAIQVGELSSSHGSARCASGHWKKLSEDFFADCEQILGSSFSSFWLIQGCQCRWSKRNPLFPQKWFKSPSLSCHLRFPEWTPTTVQTGYFLDWKFEWWWVGMVGWEPMISWGCRNSQCFPHLGGGIPWSSLGWGIRESNRFPKSASTSSLSALPRTRFLSLGYGGVYGHTMVLHHGISCVFETPKFGIKFRGQPFKFRDEWRFGTKKSPGFHPLEFPWNEGPLTGSGVRAFTPLIYSDRPPKTCRKRGISVWRLILN